MHEFLRDLHENDINVVVQTSQTKLMQLPCGASEF